jgi:hypothetical protein
VNPDARLRRALLPVDPPDGFAHRVRARVEQQSRAPVARRPARVLRYGAAAAALLAVLGGPLAWREYDQRRQGFAARAQVLLALQIASRELNSVHRRVVRPTAIRLEPQRSEVLGKEGRP